MIAALSAVMALVVVAFAILISLVGWGGQVGRAQRIGLCLMAAGLVWAAPARFLGYAPGLGDLAFLTGIALYIWAIHGPALWRSADALDGEVDGHISASALPRSRP